MKTKFSTFAGLPPALRVEDLMPILNIAALCDIFRPHPFIKK